ncbi:MAG TPA: ATP phosphoribosyltransferase [Devosiaceae bacterium]|jgi:ATP phosphoribosyltransferase|nr:ATP phosphoribosyltransferase [Devosiaceae bacterium]
MSGLSLGIPSKGRLEEQTREAFARSGMPIERPNGARSYQGSSPRAPDLTIRFMPASEIARELIRGTLDLGVTGADLIEDGTEASEKVVLPAKPLDFGHADVVVAVPAPWIDVTRMDDLADVAADFRTRHGRWLRVGTKYVNLTRRFFARHGIIEYRIVESSGATEAAPISGISDFIVDITSSGSTLAANGLRVLEDGTILKSEAQLYVSRAAEWTPMRRAQLEAFMSIVDWVPPGISTGL